MSDEVEPISSALESIEAMKRTFARMRQWQNTDAGRRARAKFEREHLERKREELAELATLRGIPVDSDVRRLALSAHPTGELFDAAREAIGWQREEQERRGGSVAVIRIFTGPPGTGKTSALAWVCATWPKRARYQTADAVCEIKRTDPSWKDLAGVSMLALDELGIEAYPDAIVELLLARWSAGLMTLCGTNFTLDMCLERYFKRAGERLADRLKEQRARGLRTFVSATCASYRGKGRDL